MKIRPVRILEVEYVAFELARKLMEWDKPIPEFGTRFPERLESCLAQPFVSFGGLLYPRLVAKASILFYLMIKNHPFENGNKRIAITTLLYFLHENGKLLRTTNEAMYEFAKDVAASDPKDKDVAIQMIEGFLEGNMENIS
jgi:death-on-curing family protein